MICFPQPPLALFDQDICHVPERYHRHYYCHQYLTKFCEMFTFQSQLYLAPTQQDGKVPNFEAIQRNYLKTNITNMATVLLWQL